MSERERVSERERERKRERERDKARERERERGVCAEGVRCAGWEGPEKK